MRWQVESAEWSSTEAIRDTTPTKLLLTSRRNFISSAFSGTITPKFHPRVSDSKRYLIDDEDFKCDVLLVILINYLFKYKVAELQNNTTSTKFGNAVMETINSADKTAMIEYHLLVIGYDVA